MVTRRFRVVRHREMGPDGREHVKETVQHPGAVTVLPILDDGRVCLIRNYRVAVGKTLIELPAGTLEPDEDPADNARRELAEETGYRAAKWRRLTEFYPAPGFASERMTAFLAEDLTAGEPDPEPYEVIEPRWFEWAAALEMIRDGEVRDAKTIAALLYCATFAAP